MKIKGCLGNGSYGTVYKIKVGTQYFALKKINLMFYLEDDQTYMIEALNQVKMLQICTYHPNIVRYYHSYKRKDSFFIIMEFVGYQNLNDLPVPFTNQKQIISFIIQIGLGLLHLKRNHIIHRDLKSTNIIISQKGLLKIADFGVSKLIKQNEYAKTCLGTPFYTAPQIILQKQYDYAVDIWSFGVILYQICHGFLPFSANNMEDLRRKIIYDDPYIKENFNPSITEIISKCFIKNPLKRITIEQILCTQNNRQKVLLSNKK